MTMRTQPTARQIRLGTELRRVREAAGVSAREVGGVLGASSSHMSQIEAGSSGISEERVRRLAAHCACADGELIEALVEMATDRTRGWWTEYANVLPPGFLDLAELEHHARSLREVAITYVPGILQTEEYARAVYAYAVPPLPASELDPRVEHRMQRRVVFQGDASIQYEAVIHESALRIRVGDRRIAREQLAQLLDLSAAPDVTLRIIPFDVDGFAGAECAMVFAGGPIPRLDTVLRDAPHGTAFLDAESQLARFRTLFRKVEGVSLGPRESRDFIHRTAKEL
ncbi:helix-turn-helix domain-containing protein [Streptomyces sp. NBC_01465]|uniref:helix-turn-helix domain-containing protein n=1 Tax=Streptomyces sp. NBC_01465 TaxID=2903878 RepID=UPI002E355621|nr:helix-turn-helix transcriptional regulator [Streptomyces sp. NBC_01465]